LLFFGNQQKQSAVFLSFFKNEGYNICFNPTNYRRTAILTRISNKIYNFSSIWQKAGFEKSNTELYEKMNEHCEFQLLHYIKEDNEVSITMKCFEICATVEKKSRFMSLLDSLIYRLSGDGIVLLMKVKMR
jgi:hypothetical protein